MGVKLAKLSIEQVAIRARCLGFNFTALGRGFYQVIQLPRGYRGKLDCVSAYLDGWEESKGVVLASG